MARYRDGLRVATCLFEAAAWHYAVKITCSCGHSVSFNPHGLWWHFRRNGLPDDLRNIGASFWCRPCTARRGHRVRPVQVELVRESETDFRLEMPDEREWKREVNRFRS